MFRYKRRCGWDGRKGVCVLFLCVSVFASAEEGSRGVEKGTERSERREWYDEEMLEQERLEDVRVTQVEMKENMPRCGKVAVTGDRLA